MSYPAAVDELLSQLRQLLGAAYVKTDGDLAEWELDWRRKARGKALAVVLPSNTEQVAQIVKICSSMRIFHMPHSTIALENPLQVSLVPQGGNTGLVGGSTPDQSGLQIVVSLKRMNAIRAIDRANLTATVEAGCILQNLQLAARSAGLLFPLSLAAEGSCTIGGNLATNAGGTQVLRYGNARDLCLGLEVVTPQGDIWHGLTGLRKDNTGYDLRNLMIGSEGTLGIVTAATVKLFPEPKARLTAWLSLPSINAAVHLLGLAQRHLGASLTGFEVMGVACLQLVAEQFPQLRIPLMPGVGPVHSAAGANPLGDSPGDLLSGPASDVRSQLDDDSCHVLLESSDHESEAHATAQFESLLELAFDALAQPGEPIDAVLSQTLAQTQAMWQVRECIPLAQAQAGLNIKHDVSLPVSQITAFVTAANAALRAQITGVRIINFGHLGDGNLHYNVQAPKDMVSANFLDQHETRVNALIYDLVQQHGGSFSAEHGIGAFKRQQLQTYKSPVALGMMRAIKAALDPQALMNPGRVL